MVIITQMDYPSESANQIAKRFVETPLLPAYMVCKGPYVGSDFSDGIRVLNIYEMDNHRLSDGLAFLSDLMAVYMGVPGFSYSIRQYLEAEEAMTLLGF